MSIYRLELKGTSYKVALRAKTWDVYTQNFYLKEVEVYLTL